MKKKLSIIAACAAMLITLGISVFTWTENKSTFLINNSDGIDSQNFTGSDGKCEKNSNTGNNNCKSGSNGAKSKTPGTAAKKDFVITIDPGHGGYDPGKVGVNNIQEKDVNLAISLILRDILTDSGFTVYLTRDSDVSLDTPGATSKKNSDLHNRIEMIHTNQSDISVSIHQNSFSDSSVHGAQVFYYFSSDKSSSLADCIEEGISTTISPDTARKSKANDNYILLKNNPCPAVIVECGFLTNENEGTSLSGTEYQTTIATAIAHGINSYYENYFLNSGTQPIPAN